ncbi:MAG TPA: ABC transporter permease [Pyrinomonadaceae bacterium]|nr:ABC transporter permease [Pyrinomonadaceae bacterium]
MKTLLKDLRYAATMLVHRPVFSMIVVAVLALGIGANATVFSLVNGVLLRRLPYHDHDRLVMVWGNFLKLQINRLPAKAAEYEDYRLQTQIFDEVAAFENRSFTLTSENQAELIPGKGVTANLFTLLGAQAEHGRTIRTEENQTGRENVVVLSHGFWQRRFGGKLTAIGQPLNLNNQNFTVIGVMPEDFQFPHARLPFGEPADVWIPVTFSTEQVAQRRGPYYLNVIAHLKTGVSLGEALAGMSAVGQRFESDYRGYRGPNGEDGGWRITLAPLDEEAIGSTRRPLLLLQGAVVLVLLVACANVANLMLVRGASRQKEIAIRLALGASHWRILRQLLVESLLLSLLGGGVGLLLAVWGRQVLPLFPAAQGQELSLDFRMLLFTFLISIFTALLFGLVPAWQASHLNPGDTLRQNASGAIRRGPHHYGRNALLVSEIALSLVLLAGAGLLIKSFLRLTRTLPAVATNSLLTAEISLSDTRYPEPQQARRFFQQLALRAEGLPGVQAASSTNVRPLTGGTRSDPFSIEGRSLDPDNLTVAGWQTVGARFFQTLGIPLIQGRDITPQDMDESGPVVAVINETMAQRYWRGENPLGKRITLGLPRPDNPWVTIIGIAKDLPQRVDSSPQPLWYLSRALSPQRNQILFIRTAGEPSAIAASVRQIVAELDRNQPVANIKTMQDVVAATMAPRRFNMLLLSLFAGIAVLLAALGIYGVVAFSVAQRSRELGIRMALGAQRSHVLGLIIKDATMLTLTGITVGLIVTVALTRMMRTLLFGVTPTDAATLFYVSILLLLVSLLACYIPARRATKVDPLVALRYE